MKYIDLFAGIGGFRYGICKAYQRVGDTSMSGCELLQGTKSPEATCVYSNEWDKYANSVYRKHFGECDDRDIREVEAKDIPEHDLLVGGFPCQSFSVAGKRGGFADTRGTLFFEIGRILKEKQPRLLLLENVKGLLSHDQGRTFGVILTTLDELGYDVQWEVLNSKNFGVPQNRERVFIVGHLRGTPRPEVFPITREVTRDNQARHDEQSGSQKFIKTRHLSQNGTLISNMITLQASEVPHLIDNSYPNRVRVFEGIAPTVRDYGSGGNKMPIVGGVRRLTPIECERLQGFPDNWTQYGADSKLISNTQRYKMCGNAVTTNVVTAVIERLL